MVLRFGVEVLRVWVFLGIFILDDGRLLWVIVLGLLFILVILFRF